MSNYRPAAVPGATYFFTVALEDRRSRVLVEHADALRAAFVATAREHPVRVDAMVVLPDHLHAVWRLLDGDADFPLRWRKLKSRFTRAVGPRVGDSPTLWRRSESKVRKGERGLWQRRYREHMIRDAEDWRRNVEYCWFNPVKHGWSTPRGTGRCHPSIATCGAGWCRRIGEEARPRGNSGSEGREWWVASTHPTLAGLLRQRAAAAAVVLQIDVRRGFIRSPRGNKSGDASRANSNLN
ncbi:MAG: transposase [Amaricoccus sp.]